MHFQHFSKDLVSIHVWRQTQTQSTINNFYEEDMNILNPRRNERGDGEGIFRMEFPLMQWIVASAYKVFGKHLVISRGFMFLIGIFSVLGIYALVYNLFTNRIMAVFAAWAFNFSPSFYYYTINPLPDNLALCFSIWGMVFFFIWYKQKKAAQLILSGLFLSLGALCKLPFIIYFIIPIVYFARIIAKNNLDRTILVQVLQVFVFSVFPIAWYLYVIPGWHGNVIVSGMLGDKESISLMLYYLQHNLISTLPELLLNYGSVLFFIAGFYFLFKRKAFKDPRFILILSLCILASVYYLFEANAIAKIHDYYLFPFYPLLVILVGYGAYNLFYSPSKFFKYFTLFLLLILPLTCYLRMQDRWDVVSPGFNSDLLVHKNSLQNAVPKEDLVVVGNDDSHFIFLYYIDKKGWGFDSNELSPEELNTMIEKGAKYLYSDSRTIDTNKEFMPFLDQLILEKGSIKIYRLKTISL